MLEQLSVDDERITIGEGTYASSTPLLKLFHPNNKIKIGNYCSLANDVTIFAGGNHPIDYITTHPLKLYFNLSDFEGWSHDCQDDNEVTTIGSDVWIGHGATILSGVTIGDGAVIGARAVVASNIPPYAIAVGNPARIIKYRFSQEIIDKLLHVAWWNWGEEKIKQNALLIASRDINSFFLSIKEQV